MKIKFQCGNCGYEFSATTETTFESAKPGEYWYAGPGFVGKCPKCTSYAHEVKKTKNGRDEWMMKCKFCGAEKTNFSTFFRNEPICSRCFDISACISSYYNKQLNAEEKAKKEEPTMKVSYSGYTGELLKLETRNIDGYPFGSTISTYDLSIYDREKQVTHSFTGVKLEDVKFLGGTVSFDG